MHWKIFHPGMIKTTFSAASQVVGIPRSLQFQVSLRVISNIFAITLLSRLLQTENLDLSAALKLSVTMVVEKLSWKEKDWEYRTVTEDA